MPNVPYDGDFHERYREGEVTMPSQPTGTPPGSRSRQKLTCVGIGTCFANARKKAVMRDDRGTMREELARFPKTGRFLASRLRHAMTENEKELLETLVIDVRETNGHTKILSRGDFCEYSTLLIEGFMTLSLIHI